MQKLIMPKPRAQSWDGQEEEVNENTKRNPAYRGGREKLGPGDVRENVHQEVKKKGHKSNE